MRWDNLLNCKKERTIFTRNQTKRYHGKRGKAIPKKRGRQTCPGNKSLLAARKYAGDPYKEKMDVNAKMVSGSRNIFKQKRAISAPERCVLTNKVKAGRE